MSKSVTQSSLKSFCAAVIAGVASLSPSMAAEPTAPIHMAASDEDVITDSAAGVEPAKLDEDAPPAAAPDRPAMDPAFLKRQQEADEKLKAEAVPVAPEHRLAKAYPNDYIVVCEAGCRSRAPDEIVSRLPRPHPAAALQMSSANPAAAPKVSVSIDCEAGCRPGDLSHPARMAPPVEIAGPATPALDAPPHGAAANPAVAHQPADATSVFAPTLSMPEEVAPAAASSPAQPQ